MIILPKNTKKSINIINNVKTFNLSNIIYKKRNNNNENTSKIYFGEYLSTDPNEMDYDDAIEKDKRTLFQYFFESIKEKHLIINTFFIVDIFIYYYKSFR